MLKTALTYVLAGSLVIVMSVEAHAWVAINGGGKNGVKQNGLLPNGGGTNGAANGLASFVIDAIVLPVSL